MGFITVRNLPVKNILFCENLDLCIKMPIVSNFWC